MTDVVHYIPDKEADATLCSLYKPDEVECTTVATAVTCKICKDMLDYYSSEQHKEKPRQRWGRRKTYQPRPKKRRFYE